MAQTILVKVQTKEHFGSILQSSDDRHRFATLREYCDAGWEIAHVSSETPAGALVVLRKRELAV
ncbi:MAG: hypothetical protein HOW73_14825 [Polyangiaceae bacterium]|nr:hypothetical protein [Polyangiaceae bacterium]